MYLVIIHYGFLVKLELESKYGINKSIQEQQTRILENINAFDGKLEKISKLFLDQNAELKADFGKLLSTVEIPDFGELEKKIESSFEKVH